MTPTQPSQAAEAAASKIFEHFQGWSGATFGWQDNIPGDYERAKAAHNQKCLDLIAKELVELARPQEVAPVGGAVLLDRGFKYENGTHTPTALVGFAVNDWDARDAFAAAVEAQRVPVALPQEPMAGVRVGGTFITRDGRPLTITAASDPSKHTGPQMFYGNLPDKRRVCWDGEGNSPRSHNSPGPHVQDLVGEVVLFTTPAAEQGGAKDARPGSFHSDSGELDRVQGPGPTNAERDVLAERARQISVEGWTPEHDDEHDDGSMAKAAACYALGEGGASGSREYVSFWPWGQQWAKFSRDRRRNLVKAGALILAEIERLDRAAILASKGGTAAGEDYQQKNDELTRLGRSAGK